MPDQFEHYRKHDIKRWIGEHLPTFEKYTITIQDTKPIGQTGILTIPKKVVIELEE